MIWKKYRNELMVLLAFIFLIIGYSYKNIQISKLYSVKSEVSKSIDDISEIIALKKQWDGKKVKSKVERFKREVSSDNIKSFNIKSRKMSAIFKDLTGKKMSKIFSKIESMAVEIVAIKVTSKDERYKMEVKCKW
jgi:hypothetical protein